MSVAPAAVTTPALSPAEFGGWEQYSFDLVMSTAGLVISKSGPIGQSALLICHQFLRHHTPWRKKKTVKLYHRTSHAKKILADGFRDRSGYYLTDRQWKGVWLSDVPLDENEGADGDTLLMVKVPKSIIAEYEWIEEGKPYREFLAPASLVNQYGPPKIVDEMRESSLLRRRRKSRRRS